jgi:hypothetical protein
MPEEILPFDGICIIGIPLRDRAFMIYYSTHIPTTQKLSIDIFTEI